MVKQSLTQQLQDQWADSSRDYVDEHTGDYHFFIGDYHFKVRKMRYAEQRRLLFILSRVSSGSIEDLENAQDTLFAKLFVLTDSDKYMLLNEKVIDTFLDTVPYKSFDFYNFVYSEIIRRLLGNFTDTVEDSPSMNLALELENLPNNEVSPRKLLVN